MAIPDSLIEELSERSLARRLAGGALDQLPPGYLGESDDGDDLAALATRALATPDTDATGETVFILPGFLGSKLGRQSRWHWGGNDLVWFDPFDIALGGLGKLTWDPIDTRIKPVGAIHRSYGRLRLELRAAGIDARYLPWDWRKSAEMNADYLSPILQAAGNVSLVTHSQGGRVARALAARDPNGALIRKVITTAAPHHGLYQHVRALAAPEDYALLKKIALLDLTRNAREIVRDITGNFPGSMELMPLIEKRPGEAFYDPAWWPDSAEIPGADCFADGEAGARALADPDARFAIIAGAGRDTPAHAVRNGDQLDFTHDDGDGSVARDLAEFAGVPTWYSGAEHSDMCNDKNVIRAVRDLLDGATTAALPTSAAAIPPTPTPPETGIVKGREVSSFFQSLGG